MSQCMENDCHDFEKDDSAAAGPVAEPHPQLGECLAAYRGDITRNGTPLPGIEAESRRPELAVH